MVYKLCLYGYWYKIKLYGYWYIWLNFREVEMDKYQRDFAENALRRASYKWKYRSKAVEKSVVEEGSYHIDIPGDRSRKKYECAMCGLIFRKKEVQVDHINPVIPLTGRDDMDGYVERMFCYEDGWQVLCKSCHKDKSDEENRNRTK
jgi:5-methylcytosine-specific restriction endonuclease McrA